MGMVCLSCIYIIDFVIYASFALDVLVPVLVAIDLFDVSVFLPTLREPMSDGLSTDQAAGAG